VKQSALGESAVDLRLVWPLVGVWCGTLLAFALAVRQWWQVALLVLVLLVFIRPARSVGAARLLLSVTVIAVLAVTVRWDIAHSRHLLAAIDSIGSGEIRFRVLEDPHERTSTKSLDFATNSSLLVDVISVDGTAMSFPALLSVAGNGRVASAAIGSEWTCRARCAPPVRFAVLFRLRVVPVRLSKLWGHLGSKHWQHRFVNDCAQ